MREFLELYAVLAAIYLFDCVHWARRDAVGLRAFFGRRRIVAGEDMPGNEQYGIVFAQPLPPFGSVFLAQPLPVALTADVASSFVSQATNPGPRPPQVARALRYEDIHSVYAETRSVHVNGELFVRTTSERLARRIAALLGDLRGLPVKARERRIATELETVLDARTAAQRVETFEAATRTLRWACLGLFVHLFVIVPAVALRLGLATSWIPLLAVLVIAQVVVVVSFNRAHRRVYPVEKRTRRLETVLLALSPPAAIRALDVLSRDLLAEIHPLAAARVLLPREDFEAFAAGVIRDARHPLPIVREEPGEAALEADRLWGRRLSAALEAFAAREELPLKTWLEAPSRPDSDYRSYCPRCAEAFTVLQGTCSRCSGLALAPY